MTEKESIARKIVADTIMHHTVHSQLVREIGNALNKGHLNTSFDEVIEIVKKISEQLAKG